MRRCVCAWHATSPPCEPSPSQPGHAVSEWWTYRPADFLMFAPGTWWRLFELHNQAWWPAQVLLLLAGCAVVVGLWRAHRGSLRAATVLLALAWAFVAWAFLWQRYAAINWSATGFAWGFAAQSVGLLVLATRPSLSLEARPARRRAGLGLLLWAVLAHPWLAPVLGRPWVQAEVFGLAPDPTAIATLGVLLCAAAGTPAARRLLGVLRAGALLWLAVSAATLGTMGSAQAWVLLGAAGVAVAVWGVSRTRA